MHTLCSFLSASILFLFAGAFDTDPSGTWKMTMAGPEGNEVVASITFTNGTYMGDFGMDGTIEVQGAYTLEDDQITLSDDKEKTTAEACEGQGVYVISVDGDSMSMSLLSDDCEGRSVILNGITMTRQ